MDYRYVYIFKVKGKKLYKIGISKDWKIRQIQIQDSRKTKLELRILLALPLFFSGYFERRLHKKYEKYRKPLKGVSGGTEFFTLKGYKGRVTLRMDLFRYFFFQLIIITLIFVTIGITLIGWSWEEFIKILLG